MKSRILVLFAAVLMFAAHHGDAQIQAPPNLSYTWAAAATGINGQLGQYLILTGSTTARPSNYTVDATVTGTAPATCTFRVEGSSDGSTWYGLDVTSPSTNSCTVNYMESIALRPVQMIRIFLTYTQGDATTSVVFHWTGTKAQ